MTEAVIIDDSKEARENLKADLKRHCPEIMLIGEAESVVSGAKLVKGINPSLLFLDIQLGDGSGFDLLDLLPAGNFKVIFTTSSDEHAVKAFKYSALDYLLKPIDPDELKKAVEKIHDQSAVSKESIDLFKEHSSGRKPFKRLALNTQDRIHMVNIDDILHCEADVNYTHFYFKGGKKLLVTRTLKEFEELLKDRGFLRVHQSHLVNTSAIKEFVKSDGGYLLLEDGKNIPVSTRKRMAVIEALNSL